MSSGACRASCGCLASKRLILPSQKAAAESGENQLLGKSHASAGGPNMDGRQISDGSESRFAAVVDGIVSVIGHADRAGPLRDYCIGLMMPDERKSVEPMAAVTAPERTVRSISRCCILLGRRLGRTRGCWPRCARWCCLGSSVTGRWRHGSSMTRACRRRGGTRSG
jgi:hypothetical protein